MIAVDIQRFQLEGDIVVNLKHGTFRKKILATENTQFLNK